MPVDGDYGYGQKALTWKTMERWRRKKWYRDNQFKKKAKKP